MAPDDAVDHFHRVARAQSLRHVVAALGPRVTRLAWGLPMGGDLEYADNLTLSRSLEGRQEF